MGRKILFRLEKEEDGTLKFTEGYAVEVLTLKPPASPPLSAMLTRGVKTENLGKVSSSKDFDPEIAVTKVVWCMNAGYESWYATGMRCGLIRIEDLNFH